MIHKPDDKSKGRARTPPPNKSPNPLVAARSAAVLDLFRLRGEVRFDRWGFINLRDSLGMTRTQVERVVSALAAEGRVIVEHSHGSIVVRLVGEGQS